MRLSLLALAFCVSLFGLASKGEAQVSMDASGMGLVILGYDNRTCDTSIEGAVRYDSSASKVQVCKPASGPANCSSIGDTCDDGSIYADLSPDGNVAMYTTPADAASTYTWNDGTTNYTDTSMANCTDFSPGTATTCQTGEANTAFLVGATGEPDYPFAAAEYCDGLSAHGYSDWYLPAQDELNVLYTNKNTGDLNGTFDESGSFPAGNYWSSSEIDYEGARYQRFSDGSQFYFDKFYGLAVRCVRKSAGASYAWTNWGE